MDWKNWYMELEQDDESWDVSEEIVLRGVVHLNFCGQPSEVEVEFIVGADSEEQAQTIEEPTQLQNTWEQYMEYSSAIHPQVLESIHHHYAGIVEKYRNAYSIWERTQMNMRLMWSGRNNCWIEYSLCLY